MTRIDSVLTSVDEGLVADAAYECKSYARALMSLENHIRLKRDREAPENELQPLYDRLHHIYCHMDEPDGMEGISISVLEPSLEHQIRHHESMGSWTSAQSCWEVRLQREPDKIEYHLGLLRCLRNLGHYGMKALSDGGDTDWKQILSLRIYLVSSVAIANGVLL
jgi:serine/threonine-protein kinase ATR